MVIENYFREKNYNLNGFGRHPSSSQRPNRMSIKKWPEKGKRKGNIKVTKKVTRKSPKTVMNIVNCKIHHWKSHQKRWRKRWITENLTGKVTKKGEGKGESPKISPKKSKKNLGSYMLFLSLSGFRSLPQPPIRKTWQETAVTAAAKVSSAFSSLSSFHYHRFQPSSLFWSKVQTRTALEVDRMRDQKP